jgi:hypothetical protein
MQRYLKKIGAAGEVKPLLQHVSDLPRRAESKVAWHLLDRRSAPSSKEGNSHATFGNRPYQGGDFQPCGSETSIHTPAVDRDDVSYANAQETNNNVVIKNSFFL